MRFYNRPGIGPSSNIELEFQGRSTSQEYFYVVKTNPTFQ